MKEWALKWVEGSVLSYVKGRTSLNILQGRIKSATKSYGVTKGEVLAILDLIEKSPVYLPSLPLEEKSNKLRFLKGSLKKNDW